MIEIPETKRLTVVGKPKEFPIVGLAAAVMAILPICFYFLLLRDPLRSLSKMSPSLLKAQEQSIQQRVGALKSLETLQENFRSLDQNAVKKISDAVPASKELPELIANVHALVDGVGGRVESLSASDPKQAGKDQQAQTKTVSIQFNVAGISYESFKMLIGKILQNSRFLNIANVQYDPKEQGASFAVTAYYLQ